MIVLLNRALEICVPPWTVTSRFHTFTPLLASLGALS